jgi:hypothetical protein
MTKKELQISDCRLRMENLKFEIEKVSAFPDKEGELDEGLGDGWLWIHRK